MLQGEDELIHVLDKTNHEVKFLASFALPNSAPAVVGSLNFCDSLGMTQCFVALEVDAMDDVVRLCLTLSSPCWEEPKRADVPLKLSVEITLCICDQRLTICGEDANVVVPITDGFVRCQGRFGSRLVESKDSSVSKPLNSDPTVVILLNQSLLAIPMGSLTDPRRYDLNVQKCTCAHLSVVPHWMQLIGDQILVFTLPTDVRSQCALAVFNVADMSQVLHWTSIDTVGRRPPLAGVRRSGTLMLFGCTHLPESCGSIVPSTGEGGDEEYEPDHLSPFEGFPNAEPALCTGFAAMRDQLPAMLPNKAAAQREVGFLRGLFKSSFDERMKKVEGAIRPTLMEDFEGFLQRVAPSSERSKLLLGSARRRIERQASPLSDAKVQMRENLMLVQERGEKIDRVETKAEQLASETRNFHDLCRQLKEKKRDSWF
jgi:hypothetical protein